MSLSLSFIFSAWAEIVKQWLAGFSYKITPISEDGEWKQGSDSFSDSSNDSESEILPKMDGINTHKPNNLNNINPVKITLQTKFSFKGFVPDPSNPTSNTFNHKVSGHKVVPPISLSEPVIFFSPRPVSELDAAAVKVQKVYKSYRTRRNLADCAVVVEELWWKALDFAALKRSSVSFFSVNKQETAVSRWARARTRAAKVGKGLSKDEKAQKLALQHWLEAIDPRHRYGHNLHLYYDVWFESESTQPFFFWLDVGDGKEVSLDNCPRTNLQHQCIKYLGPKERQAYEVIVENGKLVYKQSGTLVETTAGSKWIFVLSTARALYVGQKKKGTFQHSSFLSGGATTAAGRLIAHDGVLEAIWPYSGHYHPTEENFREFISFLKEHCVDLTDVKRYALDDDSPSFVLVDESKPESTLDPANALECYISSKEDGPANETTAMSQRLSCKWSTGAGPRIGCVRDYPQDLQCRALEQVNLSPRIMPGTFGNYGPIPSPRPSPTVRLSPRLAYMGLPSPRTSITVTN